MDGKTRRGLWLSCLYIVNLDKWQKHKNFYPEVAVQGVFGVNQTKNKYLVSCKELHFVQCADMWLSGEFLGKP